MIGKKIVYNKNGRQRTAVVLDKFRAADHDYVRSNKIIDFYLVKILDKELEGEITSILPNHVIKVLASN